MKQYVFYGSLIILLSIATPLFWLKLMQWAFLDDKTIIGEGISLVGAILGGVISGALTLIGVKLTIDQQREMFERQEEKYAEDKYNGAQYIKTEVFHLIIGVETAIKSFKPNKLEENLKSVYDASSKLDETAKKVMPQASNISATLLNALKNVSWAAQDIKEFIDEAIERDFSQEEVIKELLNGRYYLRLATADELFYTTVDSIKLKK